jgi:hypothetical protein
MTSQRNPKQHSENKLNETLTDTLAETLNWHPKETLNETLNETPNWNPKWMIPQMKLPKCDPYYNSLIYPDNNYTR